MKVEEIVPPPVETLVVLTLTIEEAALIREFARYYAVTEIAVMPAEAAARCRDLLDPYNSKFKYPYDKAFR